MSMFPYQPEGDAMGKAMQGALYALYQKKPETYGPAFFPNQYAAQNAAGTLPGSSSSGGGGGAQPGPAFQWQFPQYSQTWAFTPPAPTPYNLPPAFDRKSPTGYAKDLPVKKAKKSKTALSPFSLPDLMAKYK